MNTFSREKALEQAATAARNRKWKLVFFTLSVLSGAAYAGYREISKIQDELEADDPIQTCQELAKRMRRAKQHPEDIFFPLPEGKKRTLLIEGASKLWASGSEKTVFIPHLPMVRASEWIINGYLFYQEITLRTRRHPGTQRVHEVVSKALVGSHNLIYLINNVDPARGTKIDRIVALHPTGAEAIIARDRLLKS